MKLEGDPNKDVKTVLGLSAQRLAHEDWSLAERWQTLVVFPADFDHPAAASVWECGERDACDGLDELVGRSVLLFDDASCRYHLHDLMREVARLPREGESDTLLAGRVEGAAERYARHYCGILGEANRLYLEGGEDMLAGLRLYDLEQRNITAGQAWAVAQMQRSDDAARLAADFAGAGVWLLMLRLTPREWIGWLEAQLDTCYKLRDRRNEGNALGNLGIAYAALGERRRAIEYHEQWLELSREIDDRRGEGAALGNLGLAYAGLGEPRRAIEHHDQALLIAREIGARSLESMTLNNLGLAYADLGELRRAMERYEQALAIARETGNRQSEGSALNNLGLAYAALDDQQRAIEFYEQRLIIAQEVGDRRGESYVLNNWADALAELGDAEEALKKAEASLAIKEEIGDPSVDETRALVARLRSS